MNRRNLVDTGDEKVPSREKIKQEAAVVVEQNQPQQQPNYVNQERVLTKGEEESQRLVDGSAAPPPKPPSSLSSAPQRESQVGAHAVEGPGHARLSLVTAPMPPTEIDEIPDNTTDLEYGQSENLISAELVVSANIVTATPEQGGLVLQEEREPKENFVPNVDPDIRPKKKCFWIFTTCCIVIALGAIAAVVAIVIGRSSDDHVENNNDITKTSNIGPTMAPVSQSAPPATMTPTNSPTQNERFQFALEHLFPISGDAINQEGTNQFKAFEWLVYQDTTTISNFNLIGVLKERYALAVFYFSMMGENWNFQSNFLSSDKSVCDWNVNENFGVQCGSSDSDSDHKTGTVTEVILSENNLVGSLPTELTLLSSLTILDLGDNVILNQIPSELGDMKNLEELYLFGNQLSGPIPSSIFEIPRLKVINLSVNNLEGSIPDTVSQASNLVQLYLALCGLDGTIPNDFSNLIKLEFLQLFGNFLDGPLPASITNLPKIKYLGLNNNLLTGLLPEFQNQPSLEYIYMKNNLFSGPFPDSIGLLPNLIVLYADGNAFSGTIPSFEANNNAIQEISLYECNLAGNITQFLLSVPKSLAAFQSAGNQFTGSLPTEIGLFSDMYFFALNSNALTGDIPTEVGNLLEMKSLGVGGNELTGSIPSELGELTKLSFLELSENLLGGEIPSEIGNLVQLTWLGLGINQNLMGTVPETFSSLTALSILEIVRKNYRTTNKRLPKRKQKQQQITTRFEIQKY